MRFFLLLMFLFGFIMLPAQVLLQIEKYGSPKTQKLGLGTYLEYRLYAYDEWQAGTIERLIPEEDIIVLNDRYVKLSDIESFRFDSPQRWSRPLGKSLLTFAASWALFSAGAALVNNEDYPYTWGDVGVSATAGASGFLIQRIFRYKKYHFDKRNRLRIVDLSIHG